MNETTTPPTSPTSTPELVRPARHARTTLALFGSLFILVAVVFVVMGMSSYDAGYTYYSAAGGFMLWAVIMLTGSGIIGGLGQRVATGSPVSE